MDIPTLAAAKSFTKKAMAGFSKVEVENSTIKFTLIDGSTISLTIPTPEDGISIIDVEVNENYHLICHLSDGTEIDAGELPRGEKGFSPKAKVEQKDGNAVLTVTDEDGTTEATLSSYDDTKIKEDVEIATEIAKGANQALTFNDYSSMIDVFNELQGTEYRKGQNVYIVTLGVPDLWISDIEEETEEYTYISDEDFITSLNAGGVQVGHYVFAMLETQKVDLIDYVKKTAFSFDEETETLNITI